MTDFIVANADSLRLGLFLLMFVGLALAELLAQRRRLRLSRSERWRTNLLLIVGDSLLVRVVFPIGAVGVAMAAQEHGWGLFRLVELPDWVAVLGAIVLLDFFIWLQHLLFHVAPMFWRVHAVHHLDLDVDVTTGVRFHPLEMLLSLGIKAGVILAVGPPVVAVVLFELLLNATSSFNHANLRIPTRVERFLRLVLVTPDMHRIHHSTERHETNSNFGFNLPWWDRLFRTYVAEPKAGHEEMTLGLDTHRQPSDVRLKDVLLYPFQSQITPIQAGRHGNPLSADATQVEDTHAQ